MIAGAGNETTTGLIGSSAQLLSEHPTNDSLVDDVPSSLGRLRRYCDTSAVTGAGHGTSP